LAARCAHGDDPREILGNDVGTHEAGLLRAPAEVSDETYPVRPETVLPDQPGHLG
jgi:hypothetical protein